VGELRREPTGELSLAPLQASVAAEPVTGGAVHCGQQGMLSGLTSWERTGCPPEQRSPRGSPPKVMISDDPSLLPQTCPSTWSSFSQLARRTRSLSIFFHRSQWD
jgi:hypothetical protein